MQPIVDYNNVLWGTVATYMLDNKKIEGMKQKITPSIIPQQNEAAEITIITTEGAI